MRSFNALLLLITITTSRGQLNYEGNPLTENTEYTAEESHYSKQHDSRVPAKFNEYNGRVIDSYVAAMNSLVHDNQVKKSSANSTPTTVINTTLRNNPLKQTSDNIDINPAANRGSLNYQVPSITFLHPTSSVQIQPDEPHTSNQRRDNTNEIQIAPSRQITSLSSPNEALNYFLKSQTPEESQIALDNYLNAHNQNKRLQGQLNTYQINNQQDYVSSLQDINQHTLSGALSNGQSVGGTTVISNPYQVDQHVFQTQPLIPSSLPTWHQIPIQNRHDLMPAGPQRQRRPFYHHFRPPGHPMTRSRQRFQARVGHYPLLHPPTSYISGGKPPSELIYTRPPSFHGPSTPLTTINNPHLAYEDATPHFPISDYPPSPKDIYWSQLYSQSYDPHYYNYIAKTGKIKPWLYGKLGHKGESGFWKELYHSFKDHGMKNIMNPMFLLGLSIPAVTLMLSAMVNKRSFNGRSTRSLSQPLTPQSAYTSSAEEIETLHSKILNALQCAEEKRLKGEDPTKCVEE